MGWSPPRTSAPPTALFSSRLPRCTDARSITDQRIDTTLPAHTTRIFVGGVLDIAGMPSSAFITSNCWRVVNRVAAAFGGLVLAFPAAGSVNGSVVLAPPT